MKAEVETHNGRTRVVLYVGHNSCHVLTAGQASDTAHELLRAAAAARQRDRSPKCTQCESYEGHDGEHGQGKIASER